MSWIAESVMVQSVLTVREFLVRHDENLKAWGLMGCVPYPIEHHPDIERARADQWEKVKHLFDPTVNTDYYANNPEVAFEDWGKGATVEDAHLHYPRLAYVHDQLRECPAKRAVDLSAHDGWMAQNLETHFPDLTVDCIDLNPTNTDAAVKRDIRGQIRTGDFRTLLPEIGGQYDAAFLFETVEHLRDPLGDLKLIALYVDRLFVSTPVGAVEGGDLPNWAVVQPAGHVHAFTPERFLGMLGEVGKVVSLKGGDDGTMFAEVRT